MLHFGGVPTLGWILESTAYTWLAARAGDEAHPLVPELGALLLVHAGELARSPELLLEAVQESEGFEAFGQRLRVENQIFLEDADPSAFLF